MQKFKPHKESWGQFIDIKINAAEVLKKEVKNKKQGEVIISSICDGWQPIEKKYKLTRNCLKILLENGFKISILTKSCLIERDFDIISSYSKAVEFGITLTTINNSLARTIEPFASLPDKRLYILEKALKLGLKTYVFCGPFLPFISDRQIDFEELFCKLSKIGIQNIYIDKLNFRYGVIKSIFKFLLKYRKDLIPKYRNFILNPKQWNEYSDSLKNRLIYVLNSYFNIFKPIFCF
jgi:DNA repair photolyase